MVGLRNIAGSARHPSAVLLDHIATVFGRSPFIEANHGKRCAMRSARECIAKAGELSKLAEIASDPDVRVHLLIMAELWLELSARSQSKDRIAAGRMYRVR
jgi:hypothetical protein